MLAMKRADYNLYIKCFNSFEDFCNLKVMSTEKKVAMFSYSNGFKFILLDNRSHKIIKLINLFLCRKNRRK